VIVNMHGRTTIKTPISVYTTYHVWHVSTHVILCVITAIIVGKLLKKKRSSLFLRLFSIRSLSLLWVQVFFPTGCSQAQPACFPECERPRFITDEQQNVYYLAYKYFYFILLTSRSHECFVTILTRLGHDSRGM
jgi:hypothetical protein